MTTTAPMLTPFDTAIWDDEILADLAAHAGEVPVCRMEDCGHPAEFALVFACCGRLADLICADCLTLATEGWDTVIRRAGGVHCDACDRRFPPTVPFGDVFRAVTL